MSHEVPPVGDETITLLTIQDRIHDAIVPTFLFVLAKPIGRGPRRGTFEASRRYARDVPSTGVAR